MPLVVYSCKVLFLFFWGLTVSVVSRGLEGALTAFPPFLCRHKLCSFHNTSLFLWKYAAQRSMGVGQTLHFLFNTTSLCTSEALFALNKTLHITYGKVSLQELARSCQELTREESLKGIVWKKDDVFYPFFFLALVSVFCLICLSSSSRVCFPRPVSVMPVNMSLATRPREKVQHVDNWIS